MKIGLLLFTVFLINGCATTGVRSASTSPWLISQERELGFGRFVDAAIQQNYVVLYDDALTAKVTDIGSELIAVSGRPDLAYEFRILNDNEVNAFTIPGYVYVHMGALQLMKGKDELAAVLAHEIAHNTQRHVAKNLRNQQVASTAVGLATLGAMIATAAVDPYSDPGAVGQAASLTGVLLAAGILSKFSRDEEREADDLAIEYLRKAGYDSQGLERFLVRLRDEKEREEGRRWRLTIFETHPLTEERIQRVRAQLNQLEQEGGP